MIESTRPAKAWPVRASSAWRPARTGWTGCSPSPSCRTSCSRPPRPMCTRPPPRGMPRPVSRRSTSPRPRSAPAWCHQPTCATTSMRPTSTWSPAAVRPPSRSSTPCPGRGGALRRDRRQRLLGVGRAGHLSQHRRVHQDHLQGCRVIGGAERGKAIIILNPADPPMIMRDTIFCAIPEDADRDAITQSIRTSWPRCRPTSPAPAAQRTAVRRAFGGQRRKLCGDHLRRGRGCGRLSAAPMRETWTS